MSKSTTVSKKAGAEASKTAWATDPTYLATRGALQSQLQQYNTNLGQQANRYDQQYTEDLNNLGYQTPTGGRFSSVDNGAWTPQFGITKAAKDGSQSFTGGLKAPGQTDMAGEWNQIDPLTSSGKAYTDQTNDYAARGMLQSSGYVADRSNLGTSFNQQLGDAQLARTNQDADYGSQAQAYLGQQNDSLKQAQLQAMANYSAKQQTNAVRAAAGIGTSS